MPVLKDLIRSKISSYPRSVLTSVLTVSISSSPLSVSVSPFDFYFLSLSSSHASDTIAVPLERFNT